MNEHDLKNLLRRAPQPKPAAGLKKQILSQVRLPAAPGKPQTSVTEVSFAGWLRRWWAALVPAAGALACSVVMAVQHGEIRDLKGSIANLNQDQATAATDQSSS